MNAREQARFDMIKRVGDFGTNNASDFTTIMSPAAALSAGQLQAKGLFSALNTATTGLIARVSQNAGSQQSGTGAFHSGSTSKAVLRDALMLELKGINRTASAIAVSQNKPEMMDKFRMPHGVSDITLVAKASAIADAADKLVGDFVAYGHETKFVDDLRDHITAFEQADVTQNTGQQTQAGATADFGPLLTEAMTKVKQLDAFIHNFYKGNAEKLGEWRTASHVERQAQKKEKAEPPKPNP